MDGDAGQVLPQEEREEGDRDEQHGVVHRAVVALVDVHRLVERHAHAALRERELRRFTRADLRRRTSSARNCD